MNRLAFFFIILMSSYAHTQTLGHWCQRHSGTQMVKTIFKSTHTENCIELESIKKDVKKLDLSYSNPSDLSFLSWFTSLKSIILRSCDIDQLIFETLNKYDLEFIELENNRIENLDFLDKFSGLRYLGVRHNKLTHTLYLKSHKDLEYLDLAQNNIEAIYFGSTPALKVLMIFETLLSKNPCANVLTKEPLRCLYWD